VVNDELPDSSIPSVESSGVQVKSETVESGLAEFDSGGRISVSREHWNNVCNKLKEMEQAISTLRSGLEQIDGGRSSAAMAPGSAQSVDANNSSTRTSPEREGIYTTHTYGEGTVHLGSRSVLAYILNKSGSLQAQALLEGGILPKLGLDNETATYPFVDLWSSDTSSFDVNAVCGALPNDQQILESVLELSLLKYTQLTSSLNLGSSIITETSPALSIPSWWMCQGLKKICTRSYKTGMQPGAS
jgi:hypothetical protein